MPISPLLSNSYRSIDATSARKDFFSILDQVNDNEDLVFQIHKNGSPVAVICNFSGLKAKKIQSFAGSWNISSKSDKSEDDFAEKLVNKIYKNRQNGNKNRKIPKI